VSSHLWLICPLSFVTHVVCLVMYRAIRDGIRTWWSCRLWHHSWAGDLFVTHHVTATHPLQHTAIHCNTLQHTATHCNTLQHTATNLSRWLVRDSWYVFSFVAHVSSHSSLIMCLLIPHSYVISFVTHMSSRSWLIYLYSWLMCLLAHHSWYVFSFVTHVSSHSWLIVFSLICDSYCVVAFMTPWCAFSFVTHHMSFHSWLVTHHLFPHSWIMRDSPLSQPDRRERFDTSHSWLLLRLLIRDSWCVFSFVTHTFVTQLSLNQMLMIDEKDSKHLIRDSYCVFSFVTHGVSSHSWLIHSWLNSLSTRCSWSTTKISSISFVTHDASSHSWLIVCLFIRDSYVFSFVTDIFSFVTHFSLLQMLMIDDKDLKHLIPMSLVGATFSRYFFFPVLEKKRFFFPPVHMCCSFFLLSRQTEICWRLNVISSSRQIVNISNTKLKIFYFVAFLFRLQTRRKKRKTFRAKKKLLKMCWKHVRYFFYVFSQIRQVVKISNHTLKMKFCCTNVRVWKRPSLK